MTISYLTIEDIGSGLFRNQVIEHLKAIIALKKYDSFQLIILNPFWKAKSVRLQARELRIELGEAFDIQVLPLMPPLRYSLKSIFLSKLTIWWLSFIIRRFVKFHGSLIHCRSYWATLVATRESSLPVLFDMRSLYPAESVAAGKIKEGSSVHKFWLNIELECLHKAAGSSVVSHAMQVYARMVSPRALVFLIPISVNSKMVAFEPAQRTAKRRKLGWESNLVVVYSGSLGYYGLNISSLASIFRKLYQSIEGVRFLVLTANNKTDVDYLFLDAGIPNTGYHVFEVSPKELGGWLSAADLGIHALSSQLDSSTRLGTKVVEYWAAGLPVIVNENVGAAADIIRELGIGYVLHDAFDEKEVIQSQIDFLLSQDRLEIRRKSLAMFDVDQIALQYTMAYDECLKK